MSRAVVRFHHQSEARVPNLLQVRVDHERGRKRMTIQFNVNGMPASTDAPPDTPLLWVIREGLKLTGTKYGCGTGLCGACMIHIDGKRAFSCQTQVRDIGGKSVTTIEGLSPSSSHPLQKA